MKHIKTYQLFEAIKDPLNREQIDWLNRCIDRNSNWRSSPGGFPRQIEVFGDFNCSGQNLENFMGIVFEGVSGRFNCINNQLTSLKGAPRFVDTDFFCSGNQLTSLKGAPKSVGRNFSCSNNQLISLEGAPEKIGGSLRCSDNPVSESTLKAIFKLVKIGRTYYEALQEYWPNISVEDRREFWLMVDAGDRGELDLSGPPAYY